MKEICEEGGIDGHFMNHSLQAACASRMYDANIPEQIIKEVTGHHSECVRVNKRTGEHLKEAASKTLGHEPSSKKDKVEVEDEADCKLKIQKQGDVCLSYKQMVENVRKTKEEMRKKLLPNYRLKAKRLLTKAKKLTVDLNLNLKCTK